MIFIIFWIINVEFSEFWTAILVILTVLWMSCWHPVRIHFWLQLIKICLKFREFYLGYYTVRVSDFPCTALLDACVRWCLLILVRNLFVHLSKLHAQTCPRRRFSKFFFVFFYCFFSLLTSSSSLGHFFVLFSLSRVASS